MYGKLKAAMIIILILTTGWGSRLYSQHIQYRYVDIEQSVKTKKEEKGSFIDSLKFAQDLIKVVSQGIGFRNEDSTLWVGTAGLWSTVPVYNFVDGFWLGQTFHIDYKINEEQSIKNIPMVYYASAAHRMIWENRLIYYYSDRMNGKLFVSGGDVSSDYDTEEHLGRLENSLYSLILGRNYMKLYRKQYVEVKNTFYPLRGIRLNSGISYQWRKSLKNHTTFSFIRDYDDQSNDPDNSKFRYMPRNEALIMEFGVDITFPSGEHKEHSNEIIYSNIPTFSAVYGLGLPVGGINNSSFRRLELAISQRFKFNRLNTMEYKAGCGEFLKKHNLWFPDFKHFGAFGLPSMRTFTDDGYFLIGYYLADTNEKWIRGSVNFMSENFMFSRLKPFNNEDFNEGFHFRYLWTPEAKHYEEFGYSVGYKDIIRVGIIASFKRLEFHDFGFTVSFPWLIGGY